MKARVTDLNRWFNALSRPSGKTNARRLLARGDSLDSIVFRDAIGFTWGKPHDGEIPGELSKIYLRWEYHGLGLGRRMMAETARRFSERGIHSFILFAELSNPTLGFYDRMGGERLRDDRGQFGGAYAWRDMRALIR